MKVLLQGRNNSLGRFMQNNFTHILFIDSDIEFDAQAVLDMLKFDKMLYVVHIKKDIIGIN